MLSKYLWAPSQSSLPAKARIVSFWRSVRASAHFMLAEISVSLNPCGSSPSLPYWMARARERTFSFPVVISPFSMLEFSPLCTSLSVTAFWARSCMPWPSRYLMYWPSSRSWFFSAPAFSAASCCLALICTELFGLYPVLRALSLQKASCCACLSSRLGAALASCIFL